MPGKPSPTAWAYVMQVRVTATDALKQDRSVNRSVTETYVQDMRNRTLGRFVQAVVQYSFK